MTEKVAEQAKRIVHIIDGEITEEGQEAGNEKEKKRIKIIIIAVLVVCSCSGKHHRSCLLQELQGACFRHECFNDQHDKRLHIHDQ